MIEIEIWKDAVGYEGLYQVSSFGRVKSLARESNGRSGKPRRSDIILKQGMRGDYKQVLIYDKYRKCRSITIHRLVAINFIKNPENKREVNHKDGNKLNNTTSNLEWATSRENSQHAHDNKLSIAVVGSKNGLSKLTEANITEIRKMIVNKMSQRKIALIFNVKQNTIKNINTGKTWKHVT